MNAMDKTVLIIVLIIILCLVPVIVYLFIYQDDMHNRQINNQTLLITVKPNSLLLISKSNLTSIVKSTLEQNNDTLLSLMNGMNITSSRNEIKSGDIIELETSKYKVNCSISMQFQNQTIKNNTLALVLINKDPKCDTDFTALNLDEWHKINQK